MRLNLGLQLGGGNLNGIPPGYIWRVGRDGVDTIGLSVDDYLSIRSELRSIFFSDANTRRDDAAIITLALASAYLNNGWELTGSTDGIALYAEGTTEAVLTRAYRYFGETWSAPVFGNIGPYPWPASEALATPDWYVDSAATGAGTGADWANAFTTIGAAHTAASAGDVIEVSGGASGKTYSQDLDLTKGVTIQGSKTAGHNGRVKHNRELLLHNTSGKISIINIQQIMTVTNKYPWNSYASSNTEFIDCVMDDIYASGRYPTVAGGSLKFTRTRFGTIANGAVQRMLSCSGVAATIEFSYCEMNRTGYINALVAGSTFTMDHCLVAGSAAGSDSVSFVDIGNSATTEVAITDTAFFGRHPIKSGASSKAPVVTNVSWHDYPTVSDAAPTYFDTSNKSTISGTNSESIDPLFTSAKNCLMGDLGIHYDDMVNLPVSAAIYQILNPEVKITHNVDIHGRNSKRPTAANIDIMRTLLAAGNEIGCHGGSHSDLADLNAITISATGTTPTLDIAVTEGGADTTTWTGTLTVTINGTPQAFDLNSPAYDSYTLLVAALNGLAVGDGVVTATESQVNHHDSLLMLCLANVTAQSIATPYTAVLNETRFLRFEMTEAILDLEAYINTASDRNGMNSVAGTTVAAPSPVYVCTSYSTAFGSGRPAARDLLQANANILGARSSSGNNNTGDMYFLGAAVDLYAFPYSQMVPTNSDMIYAFCAFAATSSYFVPMLHHGSEVKYNGTTQAFKDLCVSLGIGSKTFSEWLTYIRTDGGWTITEPNAAFTGNPDDYLSQGDYTLLANSPLKGAGSI